MTTPRRRHALSRYRAVAATVLLVPTLAACGFGAQTNQQYQSAAGPDSDQVKDASGTLANSKSPIQVYNAAIVIDKVGATQGVFVGSFVNNLAANPNQSITDPTTTATVTSMSVTQPAGGTTDLGLKLAANTSYNPQPFSCGTGNYGLKVQIPANLVDSQNVSAEGAYVTMTFAVTLANMTDQTVTMRVPVFTEDGAGGIYGPYFNNVPSTTATHCAPATVGETPLAAAIASPAPAASPSTSTTPMSTATPTAATTPTP